jgi:hypothetical protein
MVLCCYLMSIDGEIPEDLEEHFKEKNLSRIRIPDVKKVLISKSKSGKKEIKYFTGILYFKKVINDFDYQVIDGLNIKTDEKKNTFSHSLGFIIFKDLKQIIFFNKRDGLHYGSKILSYLLFKKPDKIKKIGFDVLSIFEDYKKGLFSDLWYQGVRGDGRITFTSQYGSNIDKDNEFITKTNKYGLGVEISSGELVGTKVAVYRSGTLNYLGEHKGGFEKELKIRHKVINHFKKYQI